MRKAEEAKSSRIQKRSGLAIMRDVLLPKEHTVSDVNMHRDSM